MALGASSGSIEMNVSENSVSSSPLEMLGAHLKAAPDSRYIRKQSVPLRRLDEEATPYLKESSSSLLKIDAQGFDLEVLKGAEALLPRLTAVQTEVPFLPMYAGEPSLPQMISFLDAKGFIPFSVFPAFMNTTTGQVYQLDLVFSNTRKSPFGACQ
jgi:hypothetical protein